MICVYNQTTNKVLSASTFQSRSHRLCDRHYAIHNAHTLLIRQKIITKRLLYLFFFFLGIFKHLKVLLGVLKVTQRKLGSINVYNIVKYMHIYI